METMELLTQVRARYLSSGDFNGLYIDASNTDLLEAAADLTRQGLIQVVSEKDYPNPHIRPWPSRRSIEEQVESLQTLTADGYGVCLYPTAAGMKGYRLPKRFSDSPYSREMARGRGTLELAFFRIDVLEQYKNDPRFHFTFDEFGAHTSIGDEAYLDETESEADKTGISHVGFAYDLSAYDPDDVDTPIIRRVAAFYGDLAELTPTHQQRWKTYEVPPDGLRPHPAWWMAQMGEFPDAPRPFEKMFFELRNINELFVNMYGTGLFRVDERPSDFGWILRPSQLEWDAFVLQLDKLLSDNISTEALNAAKAPTENLGGQKLGTINRLKEFLVEDGAVELYVDRWLSPIREVRAARQRPAHALRKNVNDKTFVHKQVDLIWRVNDSLQMIRSRLQKNPANASWTARYGDPDRGYRF